MLKNFPSEKYTFFTETFCLFKFSIVLYFQVFLFVFLKNRK